VTVPRPASRTSAEDLAGLELEGGYDILVQKATMKILAGSSSEGEVMLLRAIALDNTRGMAYRILGDA